MSFTLPRRRGRFPLCGGRPRPSSDREEDDHSGLDGLCAGDSPRRSDSMGGKNQKSSNVHAVGGKKRKSSNERGSRLSSITPSSHVAAACTAPSSVVSAATNADPWRRVGCCDAGVDDNGEECVDGEGNGMWNGYECVDGFRQRG